MNIHVNRPQAGAQSIPSAFLAQERDRQAAIKRLLHLRQEAADEIERLLTFLDQSDEYVITECEPSLTGYSTGMDDCEGDDPDEEASLGSFDRMFDQSRSWRAVRESPDVDAELDVCDNEEGAEDEGAQCDDEGHVESGIADFDGYMEQCPGLFAHCDQRVDA